jgi:hypothetical protein
MEEILRTFLGLAPSEKILHGSDWSVPETLGYCAYNARHVMAKILRDIVRITAGEVQISVSESVLTNSGATENGRGMSNPICVTGYEEATRT